MSGIRKVAKDLFARTKKYIKSIGRKKPGETEELKTAPGQERAEEGEVGLRFKLLAILILLTLLPLLAAGYQTLNMIAENMDEQTRITVEKDARTAEYIFEHRLDECAFQVGIAANNPKMLQALEKDDYERVLAALYSDKAGYGLDFLTLLDTDYFVKVRANSGELEPGTKVDFALLEKGLHGTISGLTVLPQDFLRDEHLLEKASVRIKDPGEDFGNGGTVEERAMALATVVPVVNSRDGEQLEGVLIGGELLNNNDLFVESIAQALGVTTTFFFEDLRVATTVLDERGEKATGTRAAQNVSQTVLVEEKPYSGRALVVDENYITSYLPLRDHAQEVVGMLYVGIPEAPFIKTKDANRNRFLLIGALSLIIALGVALKFSKGITDPLNLIVDGMRNVAYTGVLDQEVEVEREDEIGKIAKGFNIMLGSLKDTLQTMRQMSEKINFSTGELSAAVQQSNAAMEEIALATGDSVARQAQEIAHVSEQAAAKGKEDEEDASEGMEAVLEAKQSMVEIEGAVQDVSTTVLDLENYSRKITMIIKTIMEIAGQTNLLALNAAIEAARAGDQGRGFAVVADEVRKLAEQSETAAGEIEELIFGIQERIKEAVKKMTDVSETVTVGDEKARLVEDKLRNIMQSIIEMGNYIDNIASGAQMQSAAAQEIAASTEEQTAVLQEISGNVSGLNSMAEELEDEVKKFNL